MKTLFAIIVLLVIAGIANFIAVFVLNFAGLPGALLAGRRDEQSAKRFTTAVVFSAIWHPMFIWHS